MNILIKNSSLDHEIENEERIYDTSFANVRKVFLIDAYELLKWKDCWDKTKNVSSIQAVRLSKESITEHTNLKIKCALIDTLRQNEWKMKWTRRKMIYLYALMKTNNVSCVRNQFIAKISVKIVDLSINILHIFYVFDFILQLFYSFEQSNIIDFQRR